MDIKDKIDAFLRCCTAIGEGKSWWLHESEVKSELRRLYEGIETLRAENEALREIMVKTKAQAVEDFAGHLLKSIRWDLTVQASEYAKQLRQATKGGE